MSNRVQFDIFVKDLGSSPLLKFASNVEKTVKRVKKVTASLDKDLLSTTKKVDSLSKSFTKVGSGKTFSGLNKSLQTASGYLDRIQQKANRLKSSGANTGSPGRSGGGGFGFLGLGSLATLAGGYLGAQGAGKVIGLGGSMEQTRIVFETMLKSAEASKQMVDNINQFANVTPYVNNDLFESAKLLLNFGRDGKHIMSDMKMLGAVAGGNKQRFDSLSLAFAQTYATGRLMGQDLLQFVSAGMNPLQQISVRTGKSMAVLKKEMEEGKISFEMVRQAFQDATGEGGRFNGLLEKMSKTLPGKWSTFLGMLQLKLTNFAENGLNGGLKKLIDFGIEFMNKFSPISDAFTRLLNATKPLISQFTGMVREGTLVENIIGGIVNMLNVATPVVSFFSYALGSVVKLIKDNWEWLKFFGAGILVVVGAMKIWTIAVAAFNAVMAINPISLWIIGISALVASIIYAYNHFESFRMLLGGIWGVMSYIAEGIGNLFTSPVETLKNTFSGLRNFFLEQFKPILEAIDLIQKGEYLKAAYAIGKAAINFTPAGMAFNVASKIGNSNAFKSGANAAKDSRIGFGLPSFGAGMSSMPALDAFGGGSPSGVAPMGSGSEEGSVKGFKSTSTGGNSIVIAIEALMKDVVINAGSVKDAAEDVKTRLSAALLEVVKDVEISYTN